MVCQFFCGCFLSECRHGSSDEGDHRKVGVQPACEQSPGAGHAYTVALDISMPQEGSGGLGLLGSG